MKTELGSRLGAQVWISESMATQIIQNGHKVNEFLAWAVDRIELEASLAAYSAEQSSEDTSTVSSERGQERTGDAAVEYRIVRIDPWDDEKEFMDYLNEELERDPDRVQFRRMLMLLKAYVDTETDKPTSDLLQKTCGLDGPPEFAGKDMDQVWRQQLRLAKHELNAGAKRWGKSGPFTRAKRVRMDGKETWVHPLEPKVLKWMKHWFRYMQYEAPESFARMGWENNEVAPAEWGKEVKRRLREQFKEQQDDPSDGGESSE